MKLPIHLLLLIAAVALCSCDRSDRAEIRKESRETTAEVKESASDLKDKAADATNFQANKLKVKGTWFEAKGRLKQKYAELTDDDLLYVEGKEDELYGRLQVRLGKSREEVEKILEGL